MGVFIMNENLVGERCRKRNAAGECSAWRPSGTLAIGVAVALAVIFHFRAPPPVVIQSPPEIKEVEKVVVNVPEKVVQRAPPRSRSALRLPRPAAPPPAEPAAPPPATGRSRCRGCGTGYGGGRSTRCRCSG